MDLEQQIQVLIDNASQYGIMPEEVKAIAPVLKDFARELGHFTYYILQSPDQRWLVTTLSNNSKPATQKQIIYAYSTFNDALSSSSTNSIEVVPKLLAVIDILLQLLAMETIDSLVFFDTEGNLVDGIEVSRKKFQARLQQYLQQYRFPAKSQPNKLPPDIA